MENNVDKNIESAIKRINGEYIEGINHEKLFYLIYPFTTENINGYINNFNLENKSLLTVGSSSDQVLSAIHNGCNDITLLDINPYTKYYYYLKIACMINLDINEYLEFFRYYDYPRVFSNNNRVFYNKLYNKILYSLKELDYESYLFWHELFNRFKPMDVRKNLFCGDENRTNVIRDCNSYLISNEEYNLTRNMICDVCPTFIHDDVFSFKTNASYDNIWLSSIAVFYDIDDIKKMVDNMSKYLNKDGQMLLSYLYQTDKNSVYQSNWKEVYNLDRLFSILSEYNPYMLSFIGTEGIKFNDDNINDSVILYRKKN